MAKSVQIYGGIEEIKFIPPLIPPPFPPLFTNLPLVGQIQISRSFEQQPSASFELESTLNKSQLQQIFAPGLEIDLYGMPLRINSVSITELPRAIYPDARCKITVSLGSKWENYLNEPVFLRKDGGKSLPYSDPYSDLECANALSATSISNLDGSNSVTVQELLAKINIPYVGVDLPRVPIESDTPRDATVNPLQLLQERMRYVNSFVRWSNSIGVEAIAIDSSTIHEYEEADILGEIETNYDAIAKTSKKSFTITNLNQPEPDHINFPSTIQSPPIPTARGEATTALAFEYPNVEISGYFTTSTTTTPTATQGSSTPRYVRKPPTREQRIDGDVDANTPLEGVALIQTMSLCFDLGGQTKTRSFVTTEDGAEVLVINEIWGFAFTAAQIYDAASGKLRGGTSCWKCLKQTRTDYIYDSTGYLLYMYESGYNTVRFKQESADSPETLQLDSSDPELALYDFIQIPVRSQTSYQLRLMPDYSMDGFSEVLKICNRDGTSTLVPLINPDYAPPYYTQIERTESVAFASRPNPANEGLSVANGDKLEPDLIVGEESRFEAITQIIPGVYEQIYTEQGNGGYPVVTQGRELSPPKYVRYVKKFKAQGVAIASALEEVSIEQSTGNPPVAQRRPPLYQREEAAKSTSTTKQLYRCFIQTPGYTANDPVRGTENFPFAKTLDAALAEAKCKLAIENWRNGLQERLQVGGGLEIKEGDRFFYWCNSEYRKRVVLSASTTLNILGSVNGIPQVTAITSLTLGRWILPDITHAKVYPSSTTTSTATYTANAQLGEALGWFNVQSRRSP